MVQSRNGLIKMVHCVVRVWPCRECGNDSKWQLTRWVDGAEVSCWQCGNVPTFEVQPCLPFGNTGVSNTHKRGI